ncbi:hypothetical protein CEUSTIGMA_g12695.t1, partial [Chlamydomonas eustigma]
MVQQHDVGMDHQPVEQQQHDGGMDHQPVEQQQHDGGMDHQSVEQQQHDGGMDHQPVEQQQQEGGMDHQPVEQQQHDGGTETCGPVDQPWLQQPTLADEVGSEAEIENNGAHPDGSSAEVVGNMVSPSEDAVIEVEYVPAEDMHAESDQAGDSTEGV